MEKNFTHCGTENQGGWIWAFEAQRKLLLGVWATGDTAMFWAGLMIVTFS
jgi:hypothetical protein